MTSDTRKGVFRAYGTRKNLQQNTLDLIDAVNKLVNEYADNGLKMSVRQLYYKLVTLGFTDGVNNKAKYDMVQAAINTGRLQGLISWTAIEDRERDLMGLGHYTNISQCLAAARNSYRIDLWADQPWRPEVWVEKKALVGVVGNICNTYRVDFFATKGYNSQSEQWNAGQRFARYIRNGQRPIVFHLGDHDPSGIDMTRDNQERLSMFTGVPVIVQRLALNMPQVEEFNVLPNYAKESDSRTSDYRAKYGDLSWELDALEPLYLQNLIKEAVLKVRDEHVWNESMKQENADLRELDLLIEQTGGTATEDDDD
jgi:hypothetical protein